MEILVGKTPNCQYQLNDPRISRQHCKIIFEGQRYFIMDMNSSNGTFVNGAKIQPGVPVPINLGDNIVLSGIITLDWNFISSFFNNTMPIKKGQNPFQPSNYTPTPNPYNNQNYFPPNVPMSQNQYAQPRGIGQEVSYALHMNKSYVGKSFITLLLYYFGFYIGGLIANILFFSEADRTKKVTGQSPPGYGCLVFLIVTHIILPLILVFLLILSGGAIWHEIVRSLH